MWVLVLVLFVFLADAGGDGVDTVVCVYRCWSCCGLCSLPLLSVVVVDVGGNGDGVGVGVVACFFVVAMVVMCVRCCCCCCLLLRLVVMLM